MSLLCEGESVDLRQHNALQNEVSRAVGPSDSVGAGS